MTDRCPDSWDGEHLPCTCKINGHTLRHCAFCEEDMSNLEEES